MESTCSTKSARWSQHWAHLKCNQPIIVLHIVVTLGQSFKMGAICNWWAHFGHSGSKHPKCAQFLTIAHIVDPLQKTFKMYPIFNCWVCCGQVLSVPTMYSPCAHWVYGSFSPVSARLLCSRYRLYPHRGFQAVQGAVQRQECSCRS